MIPGFERIAEPAYVEDLADQPITEVRQRRDECQALENAVSYVRRVGHGRLDIAGTELAARSSGDDAAALADLVERIPDTLGEGARVQGLPQRAAPALEPDEEVVVPIMADLDDILGPSELASLPDLDTETLATTVARLQAFDADISLKRRKLHDIIDELQAEISRRYQAGELSVDSLLS